MKQLRVLTGLHAGTQLLLSASRYRIAADDEADIQIADWQQEALLLQLQEEDQVVTLAIESQANAAAADTQPSAWQVFEDFMPRRFGDLVLCVGPHGAEWPTDMELLERLMRPAAQAAAAVGKAPRHAARLMLLLGAGALALAGTFFTVVSRQAGAAQARVVPESLLSQVLRAVAGGPFQGVTARAAGERVIVEGLLANGADTEALRQVLARFPASRIEHRYAAANEIAQSIVDALPGRGSLVAEYLGNGRFVVTGQAQALGKVREAAARVAGDLAPLVRSIEVVAAEAPAPDRVPVGALLATEGLQYVQTRDGAKHLTLIQEPIAALTDVAPGPTR